MPGRFSYDRIGMGDECPVCREIVYWGLWAHIEACLKRKQQAAYRERSNRQTQEINDALRKPANR